MAASEAEGQAAPEVGLMSGSLDGPVYMCPIHNIEVNAFNPVGCHLCVEKSEHVIHTISYESEMDALWPCIRAKCSCGASWTHQESDSDAERLSIFKSHLAYALRQATRVD